MIIGGWDNLESWMSNGDIINMIIIELDDTENNYDFVFIARNTISINKNKGDLIRNSDLQYTKTKK